MFGCGPYTFLSFVAYNSELQKYEQAINQDFRGDYASLQVSKEKFEDFAQHSKFSGDCITEAFGEFASGKEQQLL